MKKRKPYTALWWLISKAIWWMITGRGGWLFMRILDHKEDEAGDTIYQEMHVKRLTAKELWLISEHLDQVLEPDAGGRVLLAHARKIAAEPKVETRQQEGGGIE